MSKRSGIEWTDATWNPVMGCTPVSVGCEYCYARAMIRRFGGHNSGFPQSPGDVTLYPERLEQPLGWRTPRRVFVCSMSDLFHVDVPFEYIEGVFDVMGRALRHTFMILTKRPERLLEFVRWQVAETGDGYLNNGNVWLGVTAENQARADERIPVLLGIPAAVHFVSIEPMLGPVDLRHVRTLDWVIVGGESGREARPMHPDWARSVRDQCTEAGVSFFFKQWGEWRAADGPEQAVTWLQNGVKVRQVEGSALCLYRVGKKTAGRELDGRTWNEFPEASL